MNDERPIEKLLRRFAKKRRDEAGAALKLHPATRRLLQGEVSRQFPKSATGRKNAFAEWFAASQGRWVYATAALSVLLIAGVVLVKQNKNPQLDAKLHEMNLAKNEAAPVKALDMDVASKEREADVARRFATPPAAAAQAPELTVNEPVPASPAPPDSYGLNRNLPRSLTFNAGTEHLRVLNDESTTSSPSPLPSDTKETALAQKTITKKSPQKIPTPEEYAAVARAGQLSSQRPAGNPVTPPSLSTVPTESQPSEVTGPRQTARFADSSARRDSKLAAPRSNTPPAPTGNAVTFESRAGVASLARGGGLERDKTQVVSQSFANQAPVSLKAKTLKAAPASPVLANFQIEQTGDRLRVIDSDGSSYLGEISAAPVSFGGERESNLRSKSEEKLAEPPSAAALASTQQSDQSQSYRVEGTNRTLNQQVVFTWNFVPLTNALVQSKTKSVDGSLNKDSLGTQQQFPTLLQNSAINGRAQINAAKEIEINAVPVTR